jgi:hypothetical protein
MSIFPKPDRLYDLVVTVPGCKKSEVPGSRTGLLSLLRINEELLKRKVADLV